jgi:hypothetical protein
VNPIKGELDLEQGVFAKTRHQLAYAPEAVKQQVLNPAVFCFAQKKILNKISIAVPYNFSGDNVAFLSKCSAKLSLGEEQRA